MIHNQKSGSIGDPLLRPLRQIIPKRDHPAAFLTNPMMVTMFLFMVRSTPHLITHKIVIKIESVNQMKLIQQLYCS